MGDEFTRKVLTSVVAQVCCQLGWHSINATPLDILVDLLHRHLSQISSQTHRYAEQFNQTIPNLDHLGLAFQDLGIRIQELEDFVQNVDSTPLGFNVPKYPLPKDSHLNFLKPGSKEVVHRPVHVHEHLPPMHPELEEESKPTSSHMSGDVSATGESINGAPGSPGSSLSPVFKRPTDLLETPAMKRVRMTMEEEGGRPLREISSVIMTTSGFLSPAREGKLPETKAPAIPSEYLDHPKPAPAPPSAASLNPGSSKSDKKKSGGTKNAPKKKELPAKKKEVKKPEKKVEEHHPPPAKKKKVTASKDFDDKLKALKHITVRKLPPAAAAAEKLPLDPDKQKLNIFKKLPKVKEEILKNSRESSPSLTITEVPQLKQEESRRSTNYDNVIDSVLKEPKPSSNKPPKNKNPNASSSSCSSFLQIEMVVEEEVILSDTFSPPHTPSAPKTPEILSKADRMAEKRRKREKKQKNRPPKDTGMVIEEEVIDDDIMDENIDRPKTPEGPMPPVFPFMSRFPAPGLIPPPPITSPLLSGLPFPGSEPSHPAMPNMPMPPATFMQPKSEPEQEPPAAEVMEEVVETELIIDKPKEHKKDKKEDKKLRKKKDKKDKNKNKEKGEKEKKRDDKKEKVKEKKDKKEKKKDRERDERADTSSPAIPKLTLKIGPSSPRPITPDVPRKLVIKPIVMKEEEPDNPPELAKFAPLVTRPPKQKVKEPPLFSEPSVSKKVVVPPPIPTPETVAFYYHDGSKKKSSKGKSSAVSELPPADDAGNKVWICPACKGPDDGTPMIGCDDCDAWYHWVCVGIQVPPEDDVNWYCKECIVRKMDSFLGKSKKKKPKKV